MNNDLINLLNFKKNWAKTLYCLTLNVLTALKNIQDDQLFNLLKKKQKQKVTMSCAGS
jgi:hypothetical protein